jgi:hypothetical protein
MLRLALWLADVAAEAALATTAAASGFQAEAEQPPMGEPAL